MRNFRKKNAPSIGSFNVSRLAKKTLLAVLINCFILSSFSFAAEKKNKKIDQEREREIEKALFIASGAQNILLKIGLADCIAYALKKNSEIKIERIVPKLRENDIKIAWSVFEPTLGFTYNYWDVTQVAANVLEGADTFNSKEAKINADITGKLITGTKYDLDLYSRIYKSDSTYQIINPSYTLEPTITITQPLFRNFGVGVNAADIFIARNNKLESINTFKDKVMEIITQTKTAYYNYTFSLESYSIDKLSWERTVKLLEINKARYAKGLVSSVDVLETEAAAMDKEKVLLSSEAAAKKTEDELKLITNLVDDPEVWNAKIEVLDKPQFIEREVNLIKSIEQAFKFRPDYQSAKLDLQNRDIKIKVAENSLLPTLDLTASFGLNGLGKDYQAALKKANLNYQDWSVGVKFSLPWGAGDRAKFDQRKLEKAQALISFKRLEQNIILEIRDKVREVNVQKRQVEVARLSREKETENFNAQKERYIAGQVSTHDILDYHDKLVRAELDYFRALIDYNIALINLEKSEGVTLIKNNIKLEEA